MHYTSFYSNMGKGTASNFPLLASATAVTDTLVVLERVDVCAVVALLFSIEGPSLSPFSASILCIRELYTQPNVRGRELYLHCTGYIL